MKVTNYSQLTISQFVAINRINESDKDLLDKQTEIAAVLHGCNPSEIEALPIEDYKKAVSIGKFFNEPMPTKITQKFKCNGVWYWFAYEINKHSWGQYISYKDLIQNKTQSEILEKTAELLAMFCVPMKRTWYGKLKPTKWDSNKVPHIRQEFYDHLTMDIANPISLFFSTLLTALTESLPEFMEAALMQEIDKNLKEAMELIKEETSR